MPLILAALLAASAAAAPAKAPPKVPPADADTVKLVEYVLRTPTNELAPETVPPFLEIDPASLPERLRDRYSGKRVELETLAKLSEGKKKPFIRRLGNDAEARCDYEEDDGRKLGIYRSVGFEEIYEDEVVKLSDRTKCTTCEMQEEFTLRMLIVKKKGEKQPTKHYLLHAKDPLFAIVGAIRQGIGTGTNFFGVASGAQCH
ncbi:MAG TPA: hypothetical protein VNI01_00390 [Elusimicrobiota bacterium]|nr:hypothetical protein [Elusimicrobiota bacterium]